MTGRQRTTEPTKPGITIIGCCKDCCGPVKLVVPSHNLWPTYAICAHCFREVPLDQLEELEAYEQQLVT